MRRDRLLALLAEQIAAAEKAGKVVARSHTTPEGVITLEYVVPEGNLNGADLVEWKK